MIVSAWYEGDLALIDIYCEYLAALILFWVGDYNILDVECLSLIRWVERLIVIDHVDQGNDDVDLWALPEDPV